MVILYVLNLRRFLLCTTYTNIVQRMCATERCPQRVVFNNSVYICHIYCTSLYALTVLKMKDIFIIRQVPNSTIYPHQGRVAHHLDNEFSFDKIYLKNLPHNHKYTRLSVFICIYMFRKYQRE